MALHLLTSDQIASSCRQRIEACELWLRRLIHDEFLQEFGADYLNTALINGDAIFSVSAKRNAASRSASLAQPASRPVDALLFDDLGAVLGKTEVYKKYFKIALDHEFKFGSDHVRYMISLLIPIRNKLSHPNGAALSLHEAERALCYSNDIISSIRKHYSTKSMTDKFPAPLFTRISDSLGGRAGIRVKMILKRLKHKRVSRYSESASSASNPCSGMRPAWMEIAICIRSFQWSRIKSQSITSVKMRSMCW